MIPDGQPTNTEMIVGEYILPNGCSGVNCLDFVGDAATVSVHVNRLREKIEDDAQNPKIIETVWGAGYIL